LRCQHSLNGKTQDRCLTMLCSLHPKIPLMGVILEKTVSKKSTIYSK
ncbi:3589_t:CDS:1, partial [Gigaspora rosea]